VWTPLAEARLPEDSQLDMRHTGGSMGVVLEALTPRVRNLRSNSSPRLAVPDRREFGLVPRRQRHLTPTRPHRIGFARTQIGVRPDRMQEAVAVSDDQLRPGRLRQLGSIHDLDLAGLSHRVACLERMADAGGEHRAIQLKA